MFLLLKTFLSGSTSLPHAQSQFTQKGHKYHAGKATSASGESDLLKEVDSLLCLADQSKLIHKHIQDVQQGPGCSGIQPT